MVVKVALAAASQCVVDYAPKAPDAVHDAAVVRLAGWMYDADPSDPQTAQALRVSGAQALLGAYREHRAGAIGLVEGPDGPGPSPAPPIPGGDIPAPPDSGHYVLTSNNGVLTWVLFPAPS